jgi:hypothetical protein
MCVHVCQDDEEGHKKIGFSGSLNFKGTNTVQEKEEKANKNTKQQ